MLPLTMRLASALPLRSAASLAPRLPASPAAARSPEAFTSTRWKLFTACVRLGRPLLPFCPRPPPRAACPLPRALLFAVAAGAGVEGAGVAVAGVAAVSGALVGAAVAVV